MSKYKKKIITYVGYTKDLNQRLKLHNISKGAKFTKGKKWIVFYKEIYNSKIKAMSREHKLKKDRKFRNILKNNFIKKNKYFLIERNISK